MTESSTQDVEPDLCGHVLDRYRLVRCLGMGGMGAVYEAEHTALGKRVAVKVLRQQFSMHEISRQRFLREARAATRVEHPHVVEISDFGETREGRVYFVMELLSGCELGELLEAAGPLPWTRARELLLQIVSALGAAHEKGVVHRDIKPSNCFLVDVPGLQGRDFVKVLDFGIAKLAGKPGEEVPALTSTDEVFGTVAYMAPEMAMGVGNDPRSDVYAVGVMMYRMLVGALPFEGGTAFQILARHVSEAPVPPRAREPSIPAGVERITLRAMAKLPEERFGSMQELAEALQRGDVGPVTEGTVRMDAGMSRESMTVEQTAVLSGNGIKTGPWASVGPAAGGTEVITGSAAALSEGMSRLSRSMQLAAVVEPILEEDERELEEDELDTPTWAVQEDEREGRAKGRLLVIGGILLGMAATLGVVAWAVAPGGGSTQEPVAIVGTRARAEPVARERVRPEPAGDEKAERELVSDDNEVDESAATAEPVAPPEPSPKAEEQPRARAEAAATPAASRKRVPRTDESVAAGLRKKVLARCRVDGSTKVHIEGMIGTGGRVVSPFVTPDQGPGACAKKVVKSASFPSGDELRAMPELWVEL